MKRLFKIFALVLGCNLFFISGVQSGISKTIDDPCNIITGEWKGSIKANWGKRCLWKGEFYGSFKDEMFELTGNPMRDSSSDPDCSEQYHDIIKGRCVDGKIYGDYPGYIYRGSIYLENFLAGYTFLRE